jgi:hypothetical protein
MLNSGQGSEAAASSAAQTEHACNSTAHDTRNMRPYRMRLHAVVTDARLAANTLQQM